MLFALWTLSDTCCPVVCCLSWTVCFVSAVLKVQTYISILHEIKKRKFSKFIMPQCLGEFHEAAIQSNLPQIHWMSIKDLQPQYIILESALELGWSLQNELVGHMNAIRTHVFQTSVLLINQTSYHRPTWFIIYLAIIDRQSGGENWSTYNPLKLSRSSHINLSHGSKHFHLHRMYKLDGSYTTQLTNTRLNE